MSETTNQTAVPPHLDVRKWAFWKKRLARASVMGGLVLVVTQFLPALQEEQRLEVHAPDGYQLKQVRLSYSKGGDPEALLGTTLRPTHPTERLVHSFELASGDYLVDIEAELLREDGALSLAQQTHALQMKGNTEILRLPAP